MKIWVDDIRTAPDGYAWCKSVNEVINILKTIQYCDPQIIDSPIDVLDLDHDAGDFVHDGGDYIKILDFMEENNLRIPIHIHSANPVGRENMQRIIKKNNWIEV